MANVHTQYSRARIVDDVEDLKPGILYEDSLGNLGFFLAAEEMWMFFAPDGAPVVADDAEEYGPWSQVSNEVQLVIENE